MKFGEKIRCYACTQRLKILHQIHNWVQTLTIVNFSHKTFSFLLVMKSKYKQRISQCAFQRFAFWCDCTFLSSWLIKSAMLKFCSFEISKKDLWHFSFDPRKKILITLFSSMQSTWQIELLNKYFHGMSRWQWRKYKDIAWWSLYKHDYYY